MPINVESFNQLFDPCPEDIPEKLIDFLEMLDSPTLIHLPGLDSSRCRVIVTLLHGNEPSGAIAVHRYLRQGLQPAVDVIFALVSIQTALADPVFSYRVLPTQRDMNRCFRPPFVDNQGRLAKALIANLIEKKPEAVVDIHNTSGMGPSFAICTKEQRLSLEVCSLFSHRLVITDIYLGALMEVEEIGCPVVTIECGGAREDHSHQVALEGLQRFLGCRELTGNLDRVEVDYFRHPVRLSLAKGATLHYHDEPIPGFDVVLPKYVEHYNFGIIDTTTTIAWLGPSGLDALRAENASGDNVIGQYFTCREGRLRAVQPLKLFMVTTNPQIAVDDCLLYAVRETDHQSPGRGTKKESG